MCSAIGIHIFEYDKNVPADQMWTTWEKLLHHVGKIHGNYISKTLLNMKTEIIPKPEHTQDELDEN